MRRASVLRGHGALTVNKMALPYRFRTVPPTPQRSTPTRGPDQFRWKPTGAISQSSRSSRISGADAVDRMIDAACPASSSSPRTPTALQMTDADIKFDVGNDLTKGRGSPGPTRRSARAPPRSPATISRRRSRAPTWCYSRRRSSGTGTGAAPVIAEIAKSTRSARSPSAWSPSRSTSSCAAQPPGRRRRRSPARAGGHADHDPEREAALDRRRRTSILDAFRMADDVLSQGVQGITDLITVPGLINLDFADVRTIGRTAGQR